MEKAVSKRSAAIPSIEKDLCGSRFSLEYLSSITGKEIVGFAHVSSTVCIQAGSHSALLRLDVRDSPGKVEVFVKKVVDVDYSHKSWVDRKRLLKYIRNEARFYTEFSDAVQGFHKCVPRCLGVIQHNLDNLEAQEKEPDSDEKTATGAILFLEPISVTAFHAQGWEKVALLKKVADRLWDHAGSYTLQNRNPKELLNIEGNWEAFVKNFQPYNPELFARTEIRTLGQRLSKVAKDIAGRLECSPSEKFATIQHGDYKSMNIFLHKGGRSEDVVFIDFASTSVGYGMADVAMHIIHALHPENKKNGEEEKLVLDIYLKTLNDHGISFDQKTALKHYDYGIIDYARFMFGRFYGESSTLENFEKRKDSMNVSYVNRNVDAAFAFAERVNMALKRVESD
eukprot:g12045.t1